MSVLGKKTFVEEALDLLDEEELEKVLELINTMDTEEPVFVSLNPLSNNFIGKMEKGVEYASVHLDETLNLVANGILVYKDNLCGIFAKGVHNNIEEYRIDTEKLVYARIYENLTAEEFRQVCNDTLFALVGGGSGGSSKLSVYEFEATVYEHDEDDKKGGKKDSSNEEEEQEILTPEQIADIWANKYDVIKAHLTVVIVNDDNNEEEVLAKSREAEPEENEESMSFPMDMIFYKNQWIDGNLLIYATGVDVDNNINKLTFTEEDGQISYELDGVEVGGSEQGESISCEYLSVNQSAAFSGSMYVSGTFSQSDNNVSFSLGNGQIGFTVNNQQEGTAATQVVTGTTDSQNIHITSSNYDYKEDQSNENRTNTIHFYNDQTIGSVYETESQNVARSAMLSYGVNSHQALCQMEITEGGLYSRAIVNENGLCIDRSSQSDPTVKPQIKLGNNTTLDENEVIQLKNGMSVTYINGGSGDGIATSFQIPNMEHINNGHYFIRTVSNGHEANVDIILTNPSADVTYYGYGVVVTDVNGTTSHGVFSLCWNSNDSEYLLTLPTAISSDVAWELQYKPF